MAPTIHTAGAAVKAFWTILAIILGALAIGGLSAVGKRGDIGDLVITALLATGAYFSWRRSRT